MRPPVRYLSEEIALAAASAIVIGLLDAALVAADLAGARGAFQFVPARIWVIAPAVWLLIAAVMSAAILPFARRWGGLSVGGLLVAIFLAIRLRTHLVLMAAALAVLLVLLLSVARWSRRWPPRPRRAMAAALVGAVCVSAMVGVAYPHSAALAAVGQRPPGPNVIVVFLDTVRYDALFDGEGRAHADLPTLARLQRDSTVFTRAFAPSPWTLPSHLSALTGLGVAELGVGFDAQIYRRTDPTLAERFHRRGYRTAAVISNSFLNAGTGVARGFDTFQQAQAALDLCRTAPGVVADTHWPWFAAFVCNWTATNVTRRALALMDDSDRPFFLMLNYMDAHDPYYVERACDESNGYRAAIRCLDRQLAPIVDWRSPRSPTVLAIVGDHGEQFGEHGLSYHGNSLYVQLLHVPLVVRPASASQARQQTEPVAITSLLSFIDDVTRDPVPDVPVAALLHPPAVSNQPSQWSALDGTWHLIVTEGGREQLYHLPSDPGETRDRIAEDGSTAPLAALRDAITRMRRAPKPDLRRFRSLGYLQ